jgi:hypothetical protein
MENDYTKEQLRKQSRKSQPAMRNLAAVEQRIHEYPVPVEIVAKGGNNLALSKLN